MPTLLEEILMGDGFYRRKIIFRATHKPACSCSNCCQKRKQESHKNWRARRAERQKPGK